MEWITVPCVQRIRIDVKRRLMMVMEDGEGKMNFDESEGRALAYWYAQLHEALDAQARVANSGRPACSRIYLRAKRREDECRMMLRSLIGD